jgi:hypothetical protein
MIVGEIEVSSGSKTSDNKGWCENLFITQLSSYHPICLTQLKLAQSKLAVTGEIIEGLLILYRKVQHIKGGVPPCGYITRHDTNR